MTAAALAAARREFAVWLRDYRANLPEWCRQVIAATIAETKARQADRIRYAAAVADGLDGAREEAWHEQLRAAADLSPGAMGGLVITAELDRPHPRPFALVAQATRKAGQPLATVTREVIRGELVGGRNAGRTAAMARLEAARRR